PLPGRAIRRRRNRRRARLRPRRGARAPRSPRPRPLPDGDCARVASGDAIRMTAPRLAVFPFVQIVAFAITLRAPSAAIALPAFLTMLAAMCFTLHVTVHETLHQPPPRGRAWIEALLSP